MQPDAEITMPEQPSFMKRNKQETTMTAEPQKTRKPRMTPLDKAKFQINAEIAAIDKKLDGMDALKERREQLKAALDTMPS